MQRGQFFARNNWELQRQHGSFIGNCGIAGKGEDD